MATEPTSGADTPVPSNRRVLLIGGVVGLLAFAAGAGIMWTGLADPVIALLGMGPPVEGEPQEKDLVAHTKKEWEGKGIPTLISLGRQHINLKSDKSADTPDSYLMFSLSLKVNLDEAHPEQFPEDAVRLEELKKRLKNITPVLNQELITYFREQTREGLATAVMTDLQAAVWDKIVELLETDFHTELERKANKEKDKVPLVDSILFEEFTIQ